jgi:hypothetical protein
MNTCFIRHEFLSFALFSSFILYLAGFDKNLRVIGNKIVFFMFMFALLCFAGFRYGIEADYWSYYVIFHKAEWQQGLDIGFKFLIDTYQLFSNSFNGFVFFIAVLSIALKTLYFSKLKHSFLGAAIYVSLFYIALEYNTIRQGLALSILLFSADFAIQRKRLPFIISVLIASCLHTSSMIFIFAYFICGQNSIITIKKTAYIIVCALCVRLFLFSHMVDSLLQIIGMLNIPELRLAQLRIYLHAQSESIFTIGFFRRIVILALFIFLNNKRRINNRYFPLYLWSCFIYILFMGANPALIRVSSVFEFAMIPMFADTKLKFGYREAYIILCLAAILLFLYITALTNGNAIPYCAWLFAGK